MVTLTQWSEFNSAPAGSVAIDPGEVAAVVESRPNRGYSSRADVVLKSGEHIKLADGFDKVMKLLTAATGDDDRP